MNTGIRPVTSAESACSGCGKPSTLKCPTCIKIQMPQIHSFCTQDCFRSHWKDHNQLHKERSFTPPVFNYTGSVRPYYVTPQRRVSDKIQQPDYALTSYPASEAKARGDRVIEVFNATDIAGIRRACHIGRLVLDAAHAAITARYHDRRD